MPRPRKFTLVDPVEGMQQHAAGTCGSTVYRRDRVATSEGVVQVYYCNECDETIGDKLMARDGNGWKRTG